MSRAKRTATSETTTATSADISFEQAFGSLQEAIGQLERGGLTLEAAIETFESGMMLANRCAEILEAAELRVTRVLESSRIDPDEPAF